MIASVFVIATCIQLSLQSSELRNDEIYSATPIDQYRSYQVETSLLTSGDSLCTTFVFPGKSLCNILITQTYTIDMQLNGTKGPRVTTFTPAFPLAGGFEDIEIVSASHINFHNTSQDEDCSVDDTVGGKEANGKKNTKWKISFAEKNYPNPQLFQVVLKLVGAVRPHNNSNIFSNIKLISDNTLPSIDEVGYKASIFLPYNHTSIHQYSIHPDTYSHIYAHEDGTYTVEYDFSGDLFVQSSKNLTLSMTFPAKYPACLKIRWPSITMWAVSGGLVVFILLCVTFQCAYDQIKKRTTTQEQYSQL